MNNLTKDSLFDSPQFINCKGRLVSLTTPLIMGIINVTNDSFYEKSRTVNESDLLKLAEKHILEGADILDLGAVSSRPGARFMTPEEELTVLLPSLIKIVREFPDILISIDTFRAAIAKASVENGAHIINDISAGAFDAELFKTVGELKVPYILMHMQGQPETMQQNPVYENVVNDLIQFFATKINELENNGIKDIIIDPGFGFGKTTEHNYELLRRLNEFKILNKPVLAGLSRKSMIYKPLSISPNEALNGTTVLNTIVLKAGAKILRVHDVKEAKETLKLVNLLKSNERQLF